MKTSLLTLLSAAVLALATATLPLPAAETTTTSRPAQEIKDMAAVEEFLSLSDAELDQLLQVIARIRALTPAERATLHQEVADYRRLPELQREQMRMGWGRMHPGMRAGAGWGQMPAEIQDGWREMMQNTTSEQHAGIQDKLQSLPPEERAAYRRQLVEEYLKKKPAKP